MDVKSAISFIYTDKSRPYKINIFLYYLTVDIHWVLVNRIEYQTLVMPMSHCAEFGLRVVAS